jgi:hypothetical protein
MARTMALVGTLLLALIVPAGAESLATGCLAKATGEICAEKEDEVDMIYKDASVMRSAEGKGLDFLILPSGDAFLAVAVDTGTPVLEYYFFKLANSDGGTVVWAPLARAPVR